MEFTGSIGAAVYRERGGGEEGRESERERRRYKYFVVTLSRSLEGQIIHEACLARESPPVGSLHSLVWASGMYISMLSALSVAEFWRTDAARLAAISRFRAS